MNARRKPEPEPADRGRPVRLGAGGIPDHAVRDPARLAALRRTALLDTAAEPSFDRIAWLAGEALAAPVGMVNLVDADKIFCKSCIGLPEPWASARELPLTHTFCPYVVASGEPLTVERAAADPRFRDMPAVTELGIAAYAGVPLRGFAGQVLGTLCVIDWQPHRWTRRDVRVLEALAGLVMTEIRLREEIRHRARERAARESADAARHRAAILAEAGRVFASTLEYPETLRRIARIVVPSLADFCLIDVIENGHWKRIASVHRDPHKERLAREAERFPPGAAPDHPAFHVLRFGEPEIVDFASDAVRRTVARSPEHLELIHRLDPRSTMIVPLIAHGRPRGVVQLISTRHDRAYGPDDLQFAREVLDRAALALDNAFLYEKALEANHAKAEFLAVMSHELRTPLTAVLGYADLLAEGIAGPLTDQQRDQISRIHASAEHLLELIEEILTYSKLESESLAIDTRETDLTSVAREAAGVIRPKAEEKRLALLVRVPDRPLVTETDPAKVRRILLNLLTNAVRFTAEGEVELRLEDRAGEAVFTVRDTGPGIEPRYLARLFEPFWQAEAATTRTTGGTGLGLPVARRLARMLGGDLSVRTERGVGSEFEVRLPLHTHPPEPTTEERTLAPERS